jgi:hypothetical protein
VEQVSAAIPSLAGLTSGHGFLKGDSAYVYSVLFVPVRWNLPVVRIFVSQEISIGSFCHESATTKLSLMLKRIYRWFSIDRHTIQ